MLASFNLSNASIAICTSEPDAIKVISGLELVFLSYQLQLKTPPITAR
jgi:hypothetical protein